MNVTYIVLLYVVADACNMNCLENLAAWAVRLALCLCLTHGEIWFWRATPGGLTRGSYGQRFGQYEVCRVSGSRQTQQRTFISCHLVLTLHVSRANPCLHTCGSSAPVSINIASACFLKRGPKIDSQAGPGHLAMERRYVVTRASI